MEVLFLAAVLAFVVGGGAVMSALIFMDRDSAYKDNKHHIDVLPHENSIKEYESELEEEKHIA